MADKFNFNLKKTAIYRSLKWAKIPIFSLSNIFKKIFLFLFFLNLLIFVLIFLADIGGVKNQSLLLGLSLIFIVLFLFFYLINLFLNLKIKNPVLNTEIGKVILDLYEYNLAVYFYVLSSLMS